MAGGFSAGGLITGIDSNALIRQIIQLERQPIVRLEQRIAALENQQEGLQSLRTVLQTLRNRMFDFRSSSISTQFSATSSNTAVLSAEAGSSAAAGSFNVDVLQLATATTAQSSARIGSPINAGAALDASGIGNAVTAGTFTINGVQINVDPTTQSLNDIIGAINGSGAGVTASYDNVSDTVTIANSAPGNTSFINFGASGDTSNFLTAIGVAGATQVPDANGSTASTSVRPLGTVNPGDTLNAVNFAGGAVTGGTFNINGVAITVDPATDSLSSVISRINSSGAGVTASFDSTTDSIRVVSRNLGSPTISFASGTSNFLDVANLTTATQTAGQNAQFTIDGGPVQTRNSNTVSDAVPGVSLTLLSVGQTSVTVGQDTESILEDVRGFVEEFNAAVSEILELTGSEGALANDISIRSLQNFLRTNIFQSVSGITGDFNSLVNVGFSSGATFDPAAPFQLSLDEAKFLEAIESNVENVNTLFSNDAENGVFDVLFNFLDEVSSTNGFLNERARAGGSIADQIDLLNDQIGRVERRVDIREARLRLQFANLETVVNSLQSQSTSLAALSAGLGN